MMSILRMLGLVPSDEDNRLRELVANSYKNIKVVGRGTIRLDPAEVGRSDEFKKARSMAKSIVMESKQRSTLDSRGGK